MRPGKQRQFVERKTKAGSGGQARVRGNGASGIGFRDGADELTGYVGAGTIIAGKSQQACFLQTLCKCLTEA